MTVSSTSTTASRSATSSTSRYLPSKPPRRSGSRRMIRKAWRYLSRGRQLRPYSLSSRQVCSPQLHLNMRTVLPLVGLSIVRTSPGFSPQ
jgi:hypothetical protein